MLWLFFLWDKVILDIHRLGFHERWLWLLDRVGLDVHGRCLDLLGQKPLIEAFAQRTQGQLWDVDVDVGQFSDKRLVFRVLDTPQWPQYTNDVILFLILVNLVTGRIMMLLVAQQDVIEQRAFTWQESTGNIEGFDVPILLLELLLFLHFWLHEAGPRGNDESHFGRDAEVGDNEELKLLQERLPGQLVLVPVSLHEVFHPHWGHLHDVSDVEIQNPLVLVQKAQNSPHIDLVLF